MKMLDPVTAVVHIDAPPARVFEFFVQRDKMTRWMGEVASLDPRRGGAFAVDIRGAAVRGEYLEVDPPHRVVVSWGYEGLDRLPPGTSTVEVRLTAHGGGTRVELEHRDLPRSDIAGHESGWTHYLARLQVAGASGDAGADPGMPSP